MRGSDGDDDDDSRGWSFGAPSRLMTRPVTLVTEAVVPASEVSAIAAPRDGMVRERAVGADSSKTAAAAGHQVELEADEGPVLSYRRTVRVEPQPDGRVRIHQRVEYELAIPWWGWLFALPTRRLLRRLTPPVGQPWWLTPARLDVHGAVALASLCALAVFEGYMGTLLTQTVTFAARQFRANEAAQGVALAVVRADVLLSLAIVAAADRRGRRRVLLVATSIGCVLTATGALAPSLAWLTASQFVARAFVTAAAILILVVAAEEMPAGTRAYAVSLLAMAAALGSGVCVLLLFVADLATGGWRLLYLVPVAAIPLLVAVGRRLPESRRFAASHRATTMAGRSARIWLLAVSSFLYNLFVIPASMYQNQFLRAERGFSAARISLFTVATETPGSVGVIVGGRLADVRGRRIVGAVGLVAGVGATAAMFLSRGWQLWTWSLVGAVVGGAVVPALHVYGPELFPTGVRGRANGLIAGAGRVGSIIGLLAVGLLSDRVGGVGRPLALLAIGPVLLAVVVLVFYPETAKVELEVLNPEDAITGEA